MKNQQERPTQGHEKIVLYLNQLIRNATFLGKLRRLELHDLHSPSGNYSTWTKEQRERHDHFNEEATSIVKDFAKIKRRCKKLMNAKYMNLEAEIAEQYGTDTQLISYARGMLRKDELGNSVISDHVDMCRIENELEEQLMPLNPGELLRLCMTRS